VLSVLVSEGKRVTPAEALRVAARAGVRVETVPGGLLLDGPPSARARMAPVLAPVAEDVAALLRAAARAQPVATGLPVNLTRNCQGS